MFRISREIDFCYGHRVCGDPECGHLHGHNGRAVITLESEQLDELGMVLDFSEIKKVVSVWIDEQLDHRMLLDASDPAVPELEALGEPLYLMEGPPTRDRIAAAIFAFAQQRGIPIVACEVVDSL
ncbi:MAG: 6-carboxytetrahydropterin synthase [Planctomycetales bacterium]|nr:6-carboxytetrahydropterin synthase [Planctomycetales bacterium]